MATPQDFLRFVLPYVPTAAEIAAVRYLVDSSVDFCMDTGVWRETLDLAGTRAGLREVELDLPFDSQLVEVTEVFHRSKRLDPKAPDQIYELGIGYSEKTSTVPQAFVAKGAESILLYPIPELTERGVLRIEAKLAPTRKARSLPDLLLSRYANTIAYGAIARLLLEPHQIYSNTQLGMEYRAMFLDGQATAKREAQEGFNRASFRTRPVYF
jgi:hypothetical protein